MFEHGFPPEWSTLKKLIWLKGSGILGAAGEVWKTVSGAIVSFVTQRSAALRKLEVAVEPVQSGTGDPSPTNLRPITGWTGCNVSHTGKNLLDPNAVEMKNSATSVTRPCFYFTVPGTYYVKANISANSGTALLARIKRADGTYGTSSKLIDNSNLTAGASFTVASGETLIVFDNTSGHTLAQGKQYIADCHVQLEAGESATTYEAFGTTYTVTFPAVGNNILDMSDGNIEVGKYIDNSGAEKSNASNFYNSAYFPVKASTAYTISTSDAIRYCSFMEYDENKGFIKRTLYGGNTPFSSQTHTMGDTTAYIIFGANPTGSTVSLSDIQQINWMLNEGSTDLPYEPYTNTVYSGTLDVLTGKLTVDKAMFTFNGTEDWGKNGGYGYYVDDAQYQTLLSNDAPISNYCVGYTPGSGSGLDTWTLRLNTSKASLLVKPDTSVYDTTDKWKAYLAEHNLQVLFNLATPVEYTLTPQEVSTLVGNNTMWADTGDIEVTYLSN